MNPTNEPASSSKPPKAKPHLPPGRGAELILRERLRQVHVGGYTAESDDAYHKDELKNAAKAYLSCQLTAKTWKPLIWPWHKEFWKPSDDPIDNLVKAGALIAAEIDRLLRRQHREQNQPPCKSTPPN